MEKENKGAKFVYYSLIATFIALYLCVALVSTLHAITFFQLANNLTLAIFLGAAFEIGQASVLFSILMTKNKHRMLAWSMMFLLTSLQITANVFASFKFMDQSGTADWTYWQRSILFWLEADTPEIYKVTIAWITGALLPIVALGMTALAADNIKLRHENIDLDYDEYDGEEYVEEDENINEEDGLIKKEVKAESETKQQLPSITDSLIYPPTFNKAIMRGLPKDYIAPFVESKAKGFDEIQNNLIQYPSVEEAISDSQIVGLEIKDREVEDIKRFEDPIYDIQPINKTKGWHLKSKYVDNDGNVFHKGKYKYTDASLSKKA